MKCLPAILFIISFPCCALLAYYKGYGPFEQSETPRSFVIQQLKEIESDPSEQVVYGASGSKKHIPLLKLFFSDKGTSLQIFDEKGRPFKGPVLASRMINWGNAYTADFNRDGKNDYLVEMWSGGNGIASGHSDRIFALSSSESYKLVVVHTMFPSEGDLLDLSGNGSLVLLQCQIIFGGVGKDGRMHNYWVYNLLSIEGTEIRLTNQHLPKFPKWVMFTFRPNHRAEDQLDEKQKEILWKRVAHEMISPEGPTGVPLPTDN